MLQQEEEHLALASQLSNCIHDKRTPNLVRHGLTVILVTRIFQICLGYEDVDDCDRIRRDPMMQLAVDTGAMDKELCFSATMCRFENMVADEDHLGVQEMFVTMFILYTAGRIPATSSSTATTRTWTLTGVSSRAFPAPTMTSTATCRLLNLRWT